MLRLRQAAGSVEVDVEIANRSRAAVADVEIVGLRQDQDSPADFPRVRVDFVPGLSTRRAVLVFRGDPGPHPHARIAGYTRP